jgi:hypothetical protein
MRIQRVRLKNFAGVVSGTGMQDVELDFGEAGPLFVTLAGGNGSGKTSILSALHPLPGTNDVRDRPVADGQEGFKEVEIRDGERVYIARHFYSPKGTVKCHLERDGEELNPNGGVGTFRDLVKEHLGCTEEYMRVGRVGPNVAGLVDLQTAKRKEYVTENFLPEVGDYLMAFKRVKEKHNELKAQAKFLGDQIGKIDPAEALSDLRDAHRARLEALESKSNAAREQAAGAAALSADAASKAYALAGAAHEAKEARKVLARAAAALESLKELNPAAAEYGRDEAEGRRAKAAVKAEQTREEVARCEERVRAARAASDDVARTLAMLESRLGRVGGAGKSVAEMTKMRDAAAKELAKAERELSGMPAFAGAGCPPSPALVAAVRELALIADESTTLRASIGWPVREIVEAGLSEAGVAETSKLASARSAEGDAIAGMDAARMAMIELVGGRKHLETLAKRPSACKIDSCAFIARALEFKDVEEAIAEAEETLAAWEDHVKDSRASRDTASQVVDVWKACKGWSSRAARHEAAVKAMGAWDLLSTPSSASALIVSSQAGSKLDGKRALRAATLREDVAAERSRVDALDRQIADTSGAEAAVEGLREDATKAAREAEDAEASCLAAEDALLAARQALAGPAQRAEFYASWIAALDSKAVAALSLKAAASSEAAHDSARDESLAHGERERAARKELSTAEAEAVPVRKAIEEVGSKIARREEFEARLADVSENLRSYELVRKALDPARGIPLLFVQEYLARTRGICNGLLDLAYGGRLRVAAFDLTEKDFLIRVATPSGGLLDDVKLASQGEKSLLTVAISLALMEQSVSKYNIFCLDELDGPLDAANRGAFVEMVRSMAGRLGMEQVFVISHNSVFQSEVADVVLLPGADFDDSDSDGKRVILDCR